MVSEKKVGIELELENQSRIRTRIVKIHFPWLYNLPHYDHCSFMFYYSIKTINFEVPGIDF